MASTAIDGRTCTRHDFFTTGYWHDGIFTLKEPRLVFPDLQT